MNYLYSDIVKNKTIVGGTTEQYDLPVNPLSHINITIDAVLGTIATGTYAGFDLLATLIDRLEVSLKGASIITGSGWEVARLGAVLAGAGPTIVNLSDTSTARMKGTLTIPFGRGLFLPSECFPAARRGEAILEIEYGTLPAEITSATITISSCELPGANPAAFLRSTVGVVSTEASIPKDVDLPIGNPIIGALIRAASIYYGPSASESVSQLELLIDNVEAFANPMHWQHLRDMYLRRVGSGLFVAGHQHKYDPTLTAAAYTGSPIQGALEDIHYGFLDLDPILDGSYALQTAGHARCNLRIVSDAASSAEIITIEYVPVVSTAPTATTL